MTHVILQNQNKVFREKEKKSRYTIASYRKVKWKQQQKRA